MCKNPCIKQFQKMVDEATFWTDKKLTTFIGKVITRTHDKQQNNLLNIISGNVKISKQQNFGSQKGNQ